MNMNEVISQLVHMNYGVQVHPNDDVNKGQSSNDIVPTAIAAAAVIDFYYNLLPSLESLIDAINLRATEYEDTPKLGRTHLMDALPITVGQELRAWSSSLDSNKKYLTENILQCQRIPIGGTAVGTGLNTHQDFPYHVINELNDVTGIKFFEAPNKFEMISNPIRLASVASSLKHLATSLAKINNDIRWMNSGPMGGLGELQLPEMQAGSSIMPGKVNPVISESVCMVATHVMGCEQIISLACVSGSSFQLNTMFPLIAYHLLENMRLLTNSMKNMQTHIIDKMTYRKEHLRSLVEESPMMITALNNIIGYDEGKRIITKYYEEIAKTKSIKKITDQYGDGVEQPKTLLQICEEELQHIDKERLRELLDPLKLANPSLSNRRQAGDHNNGSMKPTKSDISQPPQADAQPLTVPWLGPYDSCQRPKP
jgi:fumarate hydratase class II